MHPANERAVDHVRKGVGLFDEEKYEDALVALQDACTAFKTLPKYANKMVDAYMKLEMYALVICFHCKN